MSESPDEMIDRIFDSLRSSGISDEVIAKAEAHYNRGSVSPREFAHFVLEQNATNIALVGAIVALAGTNASVRSERLDKAVAQLERQADHIQKLVIRLLLGIPELDHLAETVNDE